ncbi:MAG: flavin reductase family protein [Clostridiales bacterium]
MSFIKVDEKTARKFLNHQPSMLITTSDGNIHNISAISWWSMVQDYPVCISLSIHHKSLNYKLAKQEKHLGMNILSNKHRNLYLKAGNISGYKVNKFKKFDLNYNYFNNTKLPYLNDSLVILKGEKLSEVPLERFDVFIYKINKIHVSDKVLNNGKVNWNIYKTMHFVDETTYFTPNFRI